MDDERIEERKKHYLNYKINISNERQEYGLSLRKKKLFNNFLKRRLEDLKEDNNDKSKYEIKKETIKNFKEYEHIEFNYPHQILYFYEEIISSDPSLDQIYLAIYTLKKIDWKQNSLSYITLNFAEKTCDLLMKNIDNIIIVNEILQILIIITYYNNDNDRINSFTTIAYIIIYNKLFKKYFNDSFILRRLINLLGNLVYNNKNIQKIFYEYKIFDSIQKIYNITLNNEKRREDCIWFFNIFIFNIHKNFFFKDNFEFFKGIINIFCDNIFNEQLTKNCLLGMFNLCNLENIKIIQYILTKEDFFNFILSLPIKYYEDVGKFICDFSALDNYICSILIKNFKLTDFFIKGLNSEYTTLFLYILNIYLDFQNDEIKRILYENGIINQIINLIKTHEKKIIYYALICIKSLLKTSNDVLLYFLYQNHIIQLLVETSLKNPEEKNLIIESIIILLGKDNENKIFKKEFNDYGIKEILNKIDLEYENKNIDYNSIKYLVNNYFN